MKLRKFLLVTTNLVTISTIAAVSCTAPHPQKRQFTIQNVIEITVTQTSAQFTAKITGLKVTDQLNVKVNDTVHNFTVSSLTKPADNEYKITITGLTKGTTYLLDTIKVNNDTSFNVKRSFTTLNDVTTTSPGTENPGNTTPPVQEPDYSQVGEHLENVTDEGLGERFDQLLKAYLEKPANKEGGKLKQMQLYGPTSTTNNQVYLSIQGSDENPETAILKVKSEWDNTKLEGTANSNNKKLYLAEFNPKTRILTFKYKYDGEYFHYTTLIPTAKTAEEKQKEEDTKKEEQDSTESGNGNSGKSQGSGGDHSSKDSDENAEEINPRRDESVESAPSKPEGQTQPRS